MSTRIRHSFYLACAQQKKMISAVETLISEWKHWTLFDFWTLRQTKHSDLLHRLILLVQCHWENSSPSLTVQNGYWTRCAPETQCFYPKHCTVAPFPSQLYSRVVYREKSNSQISLPEFSSIFALVRDCNLLEVLREINIDLFFNFSPD